MVPSTFMFLESLPLTPNGKIDRRALPAPEKGRGLNVPERGVTDRLEFEVVHHWKKLLGVERVGIYDNFFDLGGDSLLAVRLLAPIEKTFGNRISLVDFFANPTVGGMAEFLRQNGCTSKWSSLFALQPRGSKPPFFWVHGDSSNFLLARYLGTDQPVYGFLHQSPDGSVAQYTSVEEIARHYLGELYSIQPEGPYFLGGYSFGGLVAFEMAQQIRTSGKVVSLLAMLEPTSFDKFAPTVCASESTSNRRIELCRRFYRHLNHLRILTTRRRFDYVMVRLIGVVRMLFPVEKFTRPFKRVAYWCYQFLGQPIPKSLWSIHLLDIYSKAARAYKPANYSAPAVLISTLSNRHGYLSRWTEVISGDLVTHTVSGDHMNILREPQLKEWAEKLRDCLIYRQTSRASSK